MRRFAILALLAFAGGCGLGETVYQGKSTSEWVKQFHGSDHAARLEAAQALGNFGPQGVAALIGGLQDGSADIREASADALGVVGPEAKGAVPYLINALKDSETVVRSRAAFALGSIDPLDTSAVPALAELLKDPDLEVRRHAALTLGRLGPGAKPALEALKEAGRDPDSNFRGLVSDAIRKINLEIAAREDIDTTEPQPKVPNGK